MLGVVPEDYQPGIRKWVFLPKPYSYIANILFRPELTGMFLQAVLTRDLHPAARPCVIRHGGTGQRDRWHVRHGSAPCRSRENSVLGQSDQVMM